MGTRKRWILAFLCAVVVALVASLAHLLTSGPGPRLEVVQQQPILQAAPVSATELGRTSNDSAYGLLLGIDVPARALVAHAVDMTPTEAIDAWRSAYEDDYTFAPAYTENLITDVRGDVEVSVYADDEVYVGVQERAIFRAPPEGWTVVTVLVSGR